MSYIDGFVIPVPTSRKSEYVVSAQKAAALFKEYGALQVVEAWGDDVADGKVTDFKRAVAATPDETVVFSWVVWPSKDVRDVANKKLQEDPRMEAMDMPFDGKRLIYGGFSTILEIK